MAIALTAEDRALLRLEDGLLVGHTCKVIALDGRLSRDALAARVGERLPAYSPLRMRLGGGAGDPAWVEDPDFDPAAHIRAGEARELDAAALREEVARLFVERLDRSRPLWQIDVLSLQGGGTALVWRLHHALADGVTAMRYARSLLWDEDETEACTGGDGRGEGAARESRSTAAVAAAEERRRRMRLARFFAREFARSRSPFDGPIGHRREVAFAELPLRELHDAAHELAGASLNDALLCVVGGAVRDWIEHHHGTLGQLRVKVPVSLHHEGQDGANTDSFFMVGVPLEHVDVLARLRAVSAATSVRKADGDAQAMDALLRELRAVSPRLALLCERAERSGRAFALNISNVPGPREPVSVLGARADSLHSIAEIAAHHAVRVAAVSMGEKLYLGFCADPEVVGDVSWIARASELQADRLLAARGR